MFVTVVMKDNGYISAREVWKKKYYEAKKQTPGLEADCLKLRTNLDSLHRKHLAALENLPPDDKKKVIILSTMIALASRNVL